MKQVEKRGIQIRSTDHAEGIKNGWLLQASASMFASLILQLAAAGLFGFLQDEIPVILLVVSGYLCILYGLLLRIRQESWFYIGSLIGMLLLILLCREWILEGFRFFWNQAGDHILARTGWIIPEWEMQFGVELHARCISLFTAVMAGMITLICCFLAKHVPMILSIGMGSLLFSGMSYFGMDAGFAWIVPVWGTAVLLLVYSGWKKSGSAVPVLFSWILCAVVTGVLLLGTTVPAIHRWTGEISEELHHRIHEKKYETVYTTLPEGNFSEEISPAETAVPVLAVTMEIPQPMYLRGFTGAVFDGSAWKKLDAEVLADNEKLLYWLNLNAFVPDAQFDTAAASMSLPQSTVTIQNMGACSFYRYVPFSMREGIWTQAENLNTDGVRGDGERSYTYSVVTGTPEEISEVLTCLQTSSDPAVLQYRKAESGYRQFIYHYYLQVSEDVRIQLAEYWDEAGKRYGDAGSLTPEQAQECALVFLGYCFPEEGTPEEIDLPLEHRAGTTYQYATVAAMTLRYFGIPARYAEGYVITEEMAAGMERGGTLTLDSSCAGAWVEVYQDGIGWIPMDLTPGMGDVMRGAGTSPNSLSHQTSRKDKELFQNQEEEVTPETDAEQPETSPEIRRSSLWNKILKGFLFLILLMIVLVLIVWIRRTYIIGKREKLFASMQTKEAVAWIFADTAGLLEVMGFDRGNGSMHLLRDDLENAFGEEFVQLFDQAADLNEKAMFSSRPCHREQREIEEKLRRWTIRKLESGKKWYQRLWIKWIRCLY